MVPWIAEFSTSRLSPLGFPLSVPEPPETPTGVTAAIGAGSACAAIFCGPASSKAGNLCGATCARGTNSGSALLPWGRGGGLLLLMPKASQPVLEMPKRPSGRARLAVPPSFAATESACLYCIGKSSASLDRQPLLLCGTASPMGRAATAESV